MPKKLSKTKQSETNKWFEKDIVPPKEKIPTSKIKGTFIERCLNLKNPVEKKWDMNNLYVGSIGELYKPEAMYDTILKFWDAGSEELTYSSEVYMGSGRISGERIATRLHNAGLTESDADKYKERKVFSEEYGWSGRIDLILDVNKIMYYGKKTLPAKKPTEKDFKVFEVKETGSQNYTKWNEFHHLPIKYRTQLTIYLYETKKHGVIDSDEGYFLILSRDNPKSFRVLDYKLEQNLLDEAKKNADIFWEHIRNKSVPDGFKPISAEFIDESLEKGRISGRNWNPLSGLSGKN
jgi:hypothetical protein